MSDERKKIKDLATELGVSNKDILTAARDLGIQAKVAGSSVSDADALRLRNRIAPPADAGRQEVKVRRRVRANEQEESVVEPVVQVEPKAPAGADEVKPEDAARAEESPRAAAPDAAPAETREKKRAKPAKGIRTVQTARVVHRPEPVRESGADAAGEAEAEGGASPAQGADGPEGKKATGKSAVSFSAEPERDATGQALSSLPNVGQRQTHETDASPAGRDTAASPLVRVISRPEDGRRKEREGRPPFRPAAGQPGRTAGADRPGRDRPAARPARPGTSSPRPGAPFAPKPAAGAGGAVFPSPVQDGESRSRRRKGRRTVEFSDERSRGLDEDQAFTRTQPRRKQRKPREAAPLGGTQPVKAAKRKIRVDEFIRVSDLAHQMGLKSGEIIKVLFGLGVMATINQSLDIETAALVASEFGYEVEKTGFSESDILEAQQEHFAESREDYRQRPPVVTIMGHVDHGKTSLLDAVRTSSVAAGEAGGITQHIGAYHVKTRKGEIVFLDTPGHEAFTAMRARGAEITDIVVLVVAADDGVMEQTKEAINHARAANVPIMVAVNKMDKAGANPERVQRELAEQGLVPEDWGGDTTFSYVSAKTRQGLDDFLEMLALQAEILELTANPDRTALGHIVEAKLDKGRGALGTVLIQQGTLHLGDAFICGVHSGRVRAMFSDQGKKVKEAGPSIPVEVQGFEGVPEAGEEFIVISDERSARRIAESRALKQRERELAKESKITLETFLARKDSDAGAQVLNLVLKADVQGSLEAISDALRKLSTDKVRINIIHGGTGAVSESDVLLSSASSAIVIGFNVRPSSKAKELAEQEKVDIRFYDVIYKLVDEVRNAMQGMLAPVEREVFLGTAEVRDIFNVSKFGTIAGCHVAEGKITRNARIRLLRDGVVVHTGKITSLRRFKDDVREVAKGYECGIGLENFNDLKSGDVIEAFEVVEEAATL
ncbi:MAG: translation initiation factor IF-2 [Desulfovibrio sp.]|jgi:translation initiation factor IF-2|nr:translation initiation factor IF-2 [Desulfovibrio sp.]